MVSFPVSEGKQRSLLTRMAQLRLREDDLEETYYRPSGKGARSRKALTGVMLLHKPTGIRVKCCRERSQGINRFIARRSIVEELEARSQNKTRHEVKAEKIRAEKQRKARNKRASSTTKKTTQSGLDVVQAEKAFLLKMPEPQAEDLSYLLLSPNGYVMPRGRNA
jgi:protein subunit release factor B